MRRLLWFSLLVLLAIALILPATSLSATTADKTIMAAATTTTTSSAAVSPSASVTPKPGGVLTIISTENPAGSIGLPAKWGGLNILYLAGIFETLLTFDAQGNVIPLLASDYQWSNNNLTLTLNLRKGVKFHDGTDFNADAALWNLQRSIEQQLAGADNIKDLKKIDDYTIQVDINKYMNTWMASFCGSGSNSTLMYSPTAYQQQGEAWAEQNPVGTGPFKFDKYVQNESLSAVRNDNYWGPKTLLDGFKWVFVTDPVTAELAFESGQGDAIINYSQPNQLVKDLSAKGYPYTNYPGLTWFLIMSSSNPNSPWNKQAVREAAEYAIDKAGICESIYYGYSKPSQNALASWDLAYDPNFQGREYNPAKAKELLAQAGYPDGFDDTFYVATQFNDTAVTTIQDNLKAVGIRTTINIMSTGKWIDLETNGWDNGIELSPLYADVAFDQHVYMYWQNPVVKNWNNAGGWWHTFIRPPELDGLVEQALSTQPKSPENKTADAALAKLMYDNEMAIPLWEGKGAIVLKDYIHDLQYFIYNATVAGTWNYTGAWMSK